MHVDLGMSSSCLGQIAPDAARACLTVSAASCLSITLLVVPTISAPTLPVASAMALFFDPIGPGTSRQLS